MPYIPQLRIGNEIYKIKDANARQAISGTSEDRSGSISTHVVWELGGINSDTGVETTRTDSVRSQFIPIGEGDSANCVRLDTDNQAGGWWSNIMYYDDSMMYLGAVRPGESQYSGSFMRIPTLSFPTAAFVRFTILTTSGNIESTHKNIYKCFVRRDVIKRFTEKIAKLQSDYDIIDLSFTKAGGISNGTPYDIAQYSARFRTVTAYPFPIGSKILIPDELVCIYKIWANMYWDAGRYDRSFFGDDTVRLDELTDSSFSSQSKDYYIALSGQTLDNYTVIDDNIVELNKIVKIAVPKSKISEEDRMSGNVSGARNLFTKVPFEFYRASYYYETYGNEIIQRSEDTRYWSAENADVHIDLPAGTYHLYFKFIENTGSSYSAVAYKVFNSQGTALIDQGSRESILYDNERTFELANDDTIGIQWKSYAGNRFIIYIYADSYDTLKMVSDKVRDLASYTGDDKYPDIYTVPVRNLVKKYDATADAGKIGYIWISDLHINSLYPERNKALKRQLMACADIANKTNIQFIVIGGDIMDRETSQSVIFELFSEAFAGVKESRRPVALILGNHDDNPYTNQVHLTKGQTRAIFVDMNTVDMVSPDSEKCYYYFDKLGYRFICLDAIDYPSGYAGDNWWGFNEDQVAWLASVLGQTTQNTIIFSHITLDEDHNSWNLGNNGGYTKDIRDLIEAYNSRSTITLYNQSYNFSTATGKVLFVHAGHAHFDEQYTKSGMTIPLLVTTCAKNETSYTGLTLVSGNTYEASEGDAHWNTTGWQCKFWPERTLGTITEASFDVVSVGTDRVDVFRVGAGEDRYFTPAL